MENDSPSAKDLPMPKTINNNVEYYLRRLVEKGGGGGGTNNYNNLENLPSVNNVTLSGNKTSSDLGILPAYPADTTISYSLKLVPVPGTPTDIPVELTSSMFTNGKVYSTYVGDFKSSGVFGTYEITIPADVTSVTFKLPHWTDGAGNISNFAIAYRINGTVTAGTLVPKSNVAGATSAGEWEMHTENVPSGATELFIPWPMDHNRQLADQSGVWGDEVCVFHEDTGYTLELQWVADIN